MSVPFYIYDLLYSESVRWGASHALGSPVTITYSFPTAMPSVPGNPPPPITQFTTFTATEQAAVVQALAMISSFTKITFTQVAASDTSAQIRFGNANLDAVGSPSGITYYSYGGGGLSVADIFLQSGQNSTINSGFSPGNISSNDINDVDGANWETLIHEIGHALGLKHPFDRNNANDPASVLASNSDNVANSIMSYTSYWPSNVGIVTGTAQSYSYTYNSLYPTTYGVYDIAALQYLYGANTTSAGNKTFAFSPNAPIIETISDAGPNDTIDASALTGANHIDLTPGATSSLAIRQSLPFGVVFDQQYDGSRAFTIAYGVNIANVIGGAGVDTIIGNSIANTFTGGGGNDVIDGGGDSDTAIYSGAAGVHLQRINVNGSVTVADNRGGSPDGTDTLTSIETLQFTDAVVTVVANVLTQYNTDGTALVSTFNIVGANYASTVFSYDKQGYNLFQRFGDLAGYAFSTYEYDYSHGNFIGQKFYYTNISGQPYSAYEADYTTGGTITRLAFTSAAGQAYSSYEYGYVGGLYASLTLDFTNVSGAPYSAYEYDYDAAGFAGSKFFYTNVSGQNYTGYEVDYSKTGAVRRVLLTGVSGQPYSSYQYDYDDGTVTASKFYYTGVTGTNYSGYEQDYDAPGVRTKLILTGMTGTDYSSHEYDFLLGIETGEKYYFTNVTGQNYYSYEVDQNQIGITQKVIFNNNDGSHTQYGYTNDLTFTALGNDSFVGGGASETFVFSNVYGHATIGDFYAHLTGSGHDVVQFATNQFADFATMLSHTADSANGAVITDGFSNTLTLTNVAKADIAANAGDFRFADAVA